MKKGKSYSCFTSKEKPTHPLVKAFEKRGLNELDFIYASHWASDAGWTVQNLVKSDKMIGDSWWGFTIGEAIKNIERAEFKISVGGTQFLTIT